MQHHSHRGQTSSHQGEGQESHPKRSALLHLSPDRVHWGNEHLHRESLGVDKKRPGVRTPDGRPSSRATPGSRCWSANRLSVGSTTRPICDPAGSHPLPQFIIFWALMRIFIECLPEHLRVVLYLAVCDVLILASKNVFEAGGEPLRQTSR